MRVRLRVNIYQIHGTHHYVLNYIGRTMVAFTFSAAWCVFVWRLSVATLTLSSTALKKAPR